MLRGPQRCLADTDGTVEMLNANTGELLDAVLSLLDLVAISAHPHVMVVARRKQYLAVGERALVANMGILGADCEALALSATLSIITSVAQMIICIAQRDCGQVMTGTLRSVGPVCGLLNVLCQLSRLAAPRAVMRPSCHLALNSIAAAASLLMASGCHDPVDIQDRLPAGCRGPLEAIATMAGSTERFNLAETPWVLQLLAIMLSARHSAAVWLGENECVPKHGSCTIDCQDCGNHKAAGSLCNALILEYNKAPKAGDGAVTGDVANAWKALCSLLAFSKSAKCAAIQLDFHRALVTQLLSQNSVHAVTLLAQHQKKIGQAPSDGQELPVSVARRQENIRQKKLRALAGRHPGSGVKVSHDLMLC